MDHLLDVVIAAIATFIGVLMLKIKTQQVKNAKLEEKVIDDAIDKKNSSLSITDLNDAVAKDLGRKP